MSDLASPLPETAARPRLTDVPDLPAAALVPEQKRADDEPAARAPVPGAPGAASGALLATRYRLITRMGSDTAAGAEFWCAEDTVLEREVALTVLRARVRDDAGATRAGEMIVKALRAGSFEHPGCARLLDVLAPDAPGMPDDVLGAAVTEWVPGRSLAEAVADAPVRPLTAARWLQPLAAAAEAAHRRGLALGCDHPQRIRITADGRAMVCFALPRADLRPADDVRGLGAVLFTLLTARWPLSGADAAMAGLASADRTADGGLPAPSQQRPGVPFELDALATGTLGADAAPGHVHTAAAVHRLLTELIEEDDRTALFPPARHGGPSTPDDVWQDGDPGAAPVDPERRRKLLIGLAALGVAVLVVLGYVGYQFTTVFGDPSSPTIVVGETVAASAPPDGAPTAAAGGVAAVADVEVYDNAGDGDNRARVSRVIDGDPANGWRTFVYRQQFPALKPGVGIMVSFVSPVQLSSLTITSPTPGSRIEVRSAPNADAAFTETVLLAETTLEDGPTPVSLANSQPVQYVLLWITELGGGGTENVTEIGEVEFRRAGV
jgi:hypothetical protein